MAQGDFTKEEAKVAGDCADTIFSALSKPKKQELIGELNDLLLFLDAAGNAAPNETD